MKHSTISWAREFCLSETGKITTKLRAVFFSSMIVLWSIAGYAYSPTGGGTNSPSNDDCSGAIEIDCGGSASGSFEGCSYDHHDRHWNYCHHGHQNGDDDDDDDDQGDDSNDSRHSWTWNHYHGHHHGSDYDNAPGVWYSFVGTGQNVTVHLDDNGSNASTSIFLYTGECPQLNCHGISYDDNASSDLYFESVEGVTYYFLVVKVGSGADDFTISVSCESECLPFLSVTCPNAATVSCEDIENFVVAGRPGIEYNDCGSELSVQYNDETISTQGCTSIISRTWIITLGDLTETCTQLITVVDTQGPDLSAIPAEVTVQCNDEIPSPSITTALDGCSGEVEVDAYLFHVGDLVRRCTLTTAYAPGPDWSFWVPVLAQNGITASANFNFAPYGILDQFGDGTAHLYGQVVNDLNPSQKFDLNIWFINKRDWTSWHALGRGYKDDVNCATPSNLYELWDYYEMLDNYSTAIGSGSLAGVELYLKHQPSNYYFGFQVGQGANNKNCNNGASAWFTYTGFNGTAPISGHGDINVDTNCSNGPESDCENRTLYVYLYGAQDNCGRVSVAFQNILVNDTTPPVFANCPADSTLECSLPIPTSTLPMATDNCSGNVEVIALPEIEEGNSCSRTITRRWQATDACGNRSLCTQVITIVDTTAPEFSATPEEEITVECSNVPTQQVLTATDNCQDNVVVVPSESIVPGECPGEYTINRSWTATDGCNNSITIMQIVHVQDTTAPTFDDYEYYTHVNCEDVDGYTITASDNCGSATVVIISEELNSGACLGVLHRVYQATDQCGNTATAEQYIAIRDLTAPVISNVPTEQTFECSQVSAGNNGYYFTSGEVIATDNCNGEVTLTYTETIVATDDDCDNSFDIIRTWVATDICENSSDTSVVVHIVDTEGPVFDFVPADTTISCDATIPSTNAIVHDLCGSAFVDYSDEVANGNCPSNRIITRTFRAADNCGNTTFRQQIITIVDNEGPSLEGEESLIVECGSDVPLVYPLAQDNCTDQDDINIEYTDVPYVGEFACPIVDRFVRVFTATDLCGNSSEFRQVITIRDTTAPEFTAGDMEISLPCDDYDGIFVEAADVCSHTEITYTDEHVSGGCQGRIIRHYTATDECGNEAHRDQIIILVDTVHPVASVNPQDITIECTEAVVPAHVTFTDNCDEELDLDSTRNETYNGCRRVITFTWSATDNCNNTTTVDQVITVVDTQAPEFTFLPQNTTVECDDEYTFPAATATDACSTFSITEDRDTIAGECASSYDIVRHFTATDACGNSVSATRYVYVRDTTAPVWVNGEEELSFECNEEVVGVVPTAYDACSEFEISADTIIYESSSCFTYGAIVYTATDACNNESLPFYQYFTIVDDQAPVVAPYTIELSLPCDQTDGIFITATDNCNQVNITYVDYRTSGACLGRIVRTYTVTDACGNRTQGLIQQIITPIDVTAPVASIDPEDEEYECGTFEFISVPTVYFADNCDTTQIVTVFDADTTYNACGYVIHRTWSGTDVCGNTGSVEQTVTVQDTRDPYFVYQPENIEAECSEEFNAGFAIAADYCDSEVSVTVVADTTYGICEANKVITRTFTATDDCGHTATYVQTITITDTTAPYWTAYVQGGQFDCEQSIPNVAPVAEDLCSSVTITYTDDTTYTCESSYEVERTWTATDACGNSSSTSAIFTFVDDQAPILITELPSEPIQVSCASDIPAPIEVEISDNCGTPHVSVSTEVLRSDSCGNQLVKVKYHLYDGCENTSDYYYLISVEDNIEPVLHNLPAESVVIPCDAEVPAPASVSVTDNCDQGIQLHYEQTIVGEPLPQGAVSRCRLITPSISEATGCQSFYQNRNWAMWLSNLPESDKYFSVQSGSLITYANGTLEVVATLVNSVDASKGGFNIHVWFDSRKSWNQWSTQAFPTGFKADCGGVAANHPSWFYYLLTANSAADVIGYGSYAGSSLNLSHAPSNKYFGFQLGDGANNLTPGNGLGGWFSWTGALIIPGQQVRYSGAGDFAFNLDCCPDYQIIRCWSASDCSGNDVSFCQTISFGGNNGNVIPGLAGNDMEMRADGATSNQNLTAFPNPANNATTFVFTPSESGKTKLEIFDMAGALVTQVYGSEVTAGTTYRVNVSLEQFAAGIYMYRLTNNGNSQMGRLIVNK